MCDTILDEFLSFNKNHLNTKLCKTVLQLKGFLMKICFSKKFLSFL